MQYDYYVEFNFSKYVRRNNQYSFDHFVQLKGKQSIQDVR